MTLFLQRNLLWTAGRPIAYVLMAFTAGAIFYSPLLWFALPATIFSLYFFRNPMRWSALDDSDDPALLLCPADGKIISLQEIHHERLGHAQIISIFLSVRDVHANWLVCSGVIERIDYTAGMHVLAWHKKNLLDNERCEFVVRTGSGATIIIRQVAGLIARRLCWWVQIGDLVKRGQQFGMIRFGSRVDIIVPMGIIWFVTVGQRVIGGQTVIGRLP